MTHRTPRSRAATAALLGLLLATGATGGALATPGTFSVTGHVSNATGDPLTCVVIAYVPGAGFFSAIADPVGGDYTLTGLQSGTQYAIREAGCVVAPDLSYIGQSWPALVTGAPSEVVSGVNFVLESSAPATLTVELRSSFGTPYSYCDVGINDPYIGWGTFSTGTTGNATVIVPPGTYKAFLPYGCDGNPQAFYGGTSMDTATSIPLAAGPDTITWQPYPATTFQVTGHLTDSDGAPLDCQVVAIDPDTGFAVKRVTPSAGAWSIVDLDPAKAYSIRATGCLGGPDIAYVGSTWPDPVQAAAGETVPDIDFALEPTTPATFDLTVLSPTDSPYASCTINLVSIEDVGAQQIVLDANGHLVRNVVPGTYVFGLPYGCGGYLATYYDGQSYLGDGDPVVFTAGGTTTLTWHPYGAPPTDTDAPSISCDTAPTTWVDHNVTLACTATDGDSGLADSGDASFTLTTSVAAGSADAAAATSSRLVCDVAGNCVTAGPFGSIQVDLADPTVGITGIIDGGLITIGASVTPGASCADVGSGIASCTISTLDTSTIGAKVVTATAVDGAGRVSTATATVTVRYGICGLQAKTARNGLTTVTFKVCTASGANLSSPALGAMAESLVGGGGPVSLVTPNGASFVYVAKSRSYQLLIATAGLPRGAYTLGVAIGADPGSYALSIRLH